MENTNDTESGIGEPFNHFISKALNEWLIFLETVWVRYGLTSVALLWIVTYYLLRQLGILSNPADPPVVQPPPPRAHAELRQRTLFDEIPETDLGEVPSQGEALSATVILEPSDDISGRRGSSPSMIGRNLSAEAKGQEEYDSDGWLNERSSDDDEPDDEADDAESE